MKRRPSLELLDSDAGTRQEIANTLRDLQMFNDWFGGTRTSERLARAALNGNRHGRVSLLEVASGTGYVPTVLQQRLAPEIQLDVTLLDRSRNHLNGSHQAVAGDAVNLPFADDSFDLVSCNLFLHHLGADELQRFTREALRVCRVAFLINDLVRDPIHLALAYAGFPLYRSRLTRNDAPASVAQAYTPGEIRELLQACGAQQFTITRHYLYRMGVVVRKRT